MRAVRDRLEALGISPDDLIDFIDMCSAKNNFQWVAVCSCVTSRYGVVSGYRNKITRSKQMTISKMPNSETTNTATFYRHEIEILIDRAIAVRDPLTARSWRWVRWSKKVAASDEALYRFHDIASAALTRFDRSAESV